MLLNLILISIGSFFFACSFLWLFGKINPKFIFHSAQGIPLIGGAGMGASFFLMVILCHFFYIPLPKEIIGLLIASFIMLGFGMVDDRQELSVTKKILAQIIAISLLISFGVRTHIVLLNEPLNLILSFFWILGITNAINLLDVMDGLAGGVCFIILLSFASISFLNGDIAALIFSLILAGSVLGFLCFNLPPAKIYMGNSGSHFLGFLLAALSLIVKYATLENQFALFAPIVILGFPIFDTFFLILMRIKKGKSAFNKSMDHMALRFLKIGVSKRKTLFLLLLWTLFFAAAGIFLTRVSDLWGWILLAGVGFSVMIFGKKMARVEI